MLSVDWSCLFFGHLSGKESHIPQLSRRHTRQIYHQYNVAHGYHPSNQFHLNQHNHHSLYCFSFRYSTFRPDCIFAGPPIIRSDVSHSVSILHFYG